MLKITFNSEPIDGDNDEYIKTKLKIYGGSVNSNFQGKKMPKQKVPCKSLWIIMLVSVLKVKKKYHFQTFLEECKYEPKKIKMENLTDDDLEKCSSDESGNKDNIDSNGKTESDDDNDESNE